jgi:hypothetical protein
MTDLTGPSSNAVDLAHEARSESAALMQALTSVASDPKFDPDKLSKMLEVVRQIKKDEAEAAFNAELAAIQAEMPRITKDGKVKYPSSKGEVNFAFATLENIDAAIRPLLSARGFSMLFTSGPTAAGKVEYVATLAHRLGHSRDSRIILPADESGGKNAIQAVGSTTSYARRYLTLSLLNIVTEGEDNDGNLVGTLTEDEVNRVLDMCLACDAIAGDKSETYEAKILRAYKVKTIGDIPRKKFKAVVNSLNDKHEALKKARGGQ